MHSEFDFIQHIKKRYSLDKVGDDCAVLPKDEKHDMLVTADLLIEDVDFRLSWADPVSIGHKALAVSLSDIAAMGGTAKWATVSIGVPEGLWNSPFLDDFYAGWHSLASIFGVELVGGDISRSPDRLVIDSVVIGEVSKGKAIRRYGGKSGDGIFVSGRLGGAAAGLKILEMGKLDREPFEQELIDLQLRPIPRLTLSTELARLDIVTSMVDLSDGISSDLAHICQASHVGALIDARTLPTPDGIETIFTSEAEIRNAILNGGEDFQLLFTVAQSNVILLDGLNVTQVGVLTNSEVLITDGTEIFPLMPDGFKHF